MVAVVASVAAVVAAVVVASVAVVVGLELIGMYRVSRKPSAAEIAAAAVVQIASLGTSVTFEKDC